jgi:hypothetical protein
MTQADIVVLKDRVAFIVEHTAYIAVKLESGYNDGETYEICNGVSQHLPHAYIATQQAPYHIVHDVRS